MYHFNFWDHQKDQWVFVSRLMRLRDNRDFFLPIDISGFKHTKHFVFSVFLLKSGLFLKQFHTLLIAAFK